MSTKAKVWIVLLVIAAIAGMWIGHECIFCNEIQNFQITQTPGGDVAIHKDGGYYAEWFPHVWTYPKRESLFFFTKFDEQGNKVEFDASAKTSWDETKGSRPIQPAIEFVFKNKGKGYLSANIIYSLINDNDKTLKMHEYFGGNRDELDKKVMSKVMDIVGSSGSEIASSEGIEDLKALKAKIKDDVVSNQELKELGITIEMMDVTAINFDAATLKLFSQQRENDLMKEIAKAEKARALEEKERAIAKAEASKAEAEGKANVLKAQEVIEAEKRKELATIKAQEEVEVAKLAKDKAEQEAEKEAAVAKIEANKLKEVAEIEKQTQTVQLETAKLQAQQMEVEAEAKKRQIELADDVSNKVKLEIETKKEVEIAKFEAIAKAFQNCTWPRALMLNIGGASTTVDGKTAANAFEQFLQLSNIEKIDNWSRKMATQLP